MDFRRIAGFGGFAFGVTVLIMNVVLVLPAKPLGDATLDEIVAYYTTHGEAVELFAFIAPLAWVAIALFAAGVVVAARTDDGPNGWAIVGMIGVATMIPTFCGVVTADLVLAARASTLAINVQFTRMLWDYHMVLQIVNLAFVAIALGGFGMAAVTSATAPRLGKLAIVGMLFLLVGAMQSTAGVTGSGPSLIALPGFVVWLVFVLGYSATMVRLSGGPRPRTWWQRAHARQE